MLKFSPWAGELPYGVSVAEKEKEKKTTEFKSKQVPRFNISL